MKIAVVTDSGSGLSKQQANELGLFYLPLQIMVNDDMYLDGENIQVEQIYEMLAQGQMPTTSMPPMGIIQETFEEIKAQGYDAVIAVPLTSGLSSTTSVMQAVAQQVELPLHVIEVYSTCNIQLYIAKCAQQLVDKGFALDEIVARLKASVKESNTLIIPGDLQHLKRGGRLTPLAAALGGLLKIKPILQLNAGTNGKIDVFDKVRTMSKAMQKAVSTFAADGLDDSYMFTVLHTAAEEDGLKLKALMEETFPGCDLYFGLICPVISAHTGLGCMGIQYIKKVEM